MKKGQAALEFLTTYGWAFLVILVMIGALAYFGVLDPTRFIPQRCQFGQEMYCERFALLSDDSSTFLYDRATFELRNNLPDNIVVGNISWAPDDAPGTFIPCADNQSVGGTSIIGSPSVSVSRNNNALFTCGAVMGLEPGEKTRVHLRIEYSTGSWDSTYAQNIFGEVFANVN